VHGLINRAIQSFLADTYGSEVWAVIAREAQVPVGGFEAMLSYDAAITGDMLAAAESVLDRPREGILEDLGTYLVSHRNREGLRRLLRFGGVTFLDFLHSLEDLPDRARLALPDLELPDMLLTDAGGDRFMLTCHSQIPGAGHIALGLLRAMADDYGALVLLDHLGTGTDGEVVAIHLLERRFAVGRRFNLAAEA
jgi:hypothetical protein